MRWASHGADLCQRTRQRLNCVGCLSTVFRRTRLTTRRVANYKGEAMLTSAGPVAAATLAGANIS